MEASWLMLRPPLSPASGPRSRRQHLRNSRVEPEFHAASDKAWRGCDDGAIARWLSGGVGPHRLYSYRTVDGLASRDSQRRRDGLQAGHETARELREALFVRSDI